MGTGAGLVSEFSRFFERWPEPVPIFSQPRSALVPTITILSFGACRILQFAALRQGHDGKRAANMTKVVRVVLVERAREPAPAVTLIRLDPGDALLDGGIAGRYAGAAEHVNRKAGGITVAAGVVLLALFILVAFPGVVAEFRAIPAAVGTLLGEHVLDRRLFFRIAQEGVEVRRGPKQHRLMVKILRRMGLQVSAKLS